MHLFLKIYFSIQFSCYRCPHSGNWYINAKRGDSEAHWEEVPHDNFFNCMYGIGETKMEYHPDHVTTANLESETCAVGMDAVCIVQYLQSKIIYSDFFYLNSPKVRTIIVFAVFSVEYL